MFTGTRPLLGRADPDANTELRRVLRARAAAPVPQPDDLRGRDDHLLLFRYRREVLVHSQRLAEANVPHRLRMARTPVVVDPWIGWLLAPFTARHLDQAGFARLWAEREMPRLFPGDDPDRCFHTLYGLGPGEAGRVDLDRVRTQLARARPPVEVCATACGTSGPILGTIHASKGREADEVVLALPPPPREGDDIAEETRVLYVGATRPRKRLRVHDAAAVRAYPLASGRLWCVRRAPWPQYLAAAVEFGLDGDTDPTAAVRPPLAATPEDAADAQRLLAEAADPARVTAHCSKEWDYDAFRLELAARPGRWVGEFTPRVGRDLLEVRAWFRDHFRAVVTKPRKIERLHLFAVRTVAVADGDPGRQALHEPYRSSGFLLAPVVLGYPWCFFRRGG
ncbi:MAG: hypothetical protein C0501_11940 [Isosphaera sp.]|nr:hypothetical protein [Isosphaera sp.]